jgi:hypothetical protein
MKKRSKRSKRMSDSELTLDDKINEILKYRRSADNLAIDKSGSMSSNKKFFKNSNSGQDKFSKTNMISF